jgi:hypothetical protein
MSHASNVVSIHPYFKIRPGNRDAALAVLQQFCERTRNELDVLYYDFTINGDTVFCREAYVGATGALAHLDNIGGVLQEFLTLVELQRLELHGPAEELEKIKPALAGMNVEWFAYECGIGK